MGMMKTLGVLGAGIFAMALAAPLTAQGHTADVIEVPLRVENGRLVVQIKTSDGHDLDFILSTGNTTTVLAESTAAHLGDHPRLALGDAVVDTEDVATVPDSQLEVDGTQYHGIIASNTLNQFDVLVDAPAGRLLLKSIGARVEWPGMSLSEPVRLRVFHGMILALDVSAGDHIFGAMLDLGTSDVLANPAAGEKLGFQGDGFVTIGVGETMFRDTPVRVSDLEVFKRFDPEGAGFILLGASLAYDCAVSISWVHREIRTCTR